MYRRNPAPGCLKLWRVDMAKTQIAKRVYVNEDGTETRGARPTTKAARMEFSNGETLELPGVGDLPGAIQAACFWHGLTAKVGDRFASAKGDAEAAYDAAAAMVERLVAGEWVKEGEGAGPRITLLVEAIVAAKAAAGQDADEAAIAAKLKDNKELRDGALANPAIKAEYEKIRAARAAAKAKEAAKAAKDADAGDLAAF
jgi:hypothetical protein